MIRYIRPRASIGRAGTRNYNNGVRNVHSHVGRQEVLNYGGRRPMICASDLKSRASSSKLLLRRTFIDPAFLTYLGPPAVFLGLVAALWIYKCFMMVIFQNKIIYMPSVPPFSRREMIKDYAKVCAPIEWKEESIRSIDGTRLSLCIGSNAAASRQSSDVGAPHVVLVYFQGNASSLPPRLPFLSSILKSLDSGPRTIPCTIIGLSYRGFWTSEGRAHQRGIEKDATAAIQRAQELREQLGTNTKLVLCGQSIGAGVASTAAANIAQEPSNIALDGLILETPFTSLRSMLVALYPQRWLPYRYLWPFLRNWWDSEAALRILKARGNSNPKMQIITAEKDEVVPPELGQRIVDLSKELGFTVTHASVPGALHTESMARKQGRTAVVSFLRSISSS